MLLPCLACSARQPAFSIGHIPFSGSIAGTVSAEKPFCQTIPGHYKRKVTGLFKLSGPF